MKKFVFLLFMLPAFSFAGDLRVFVTDKDLDFPLEGAKVTLAGSTSFTDEDGLAIINLPDSLIQGNLTVSLPGYDERSLSFKAGEESLQVTLSISGVIEGKELVVNRTSPERSEEKAGISALITKEEMNTTANVGIVEDCLSSIRTLPGVSYSGAWGSEPSVRGGEPREMGFLLDGMYLLFPYHWGGSVSFFTPVMIESIKLYNGVFSAKYGRASSGLLEASTLKPDYQHFHMNTGSSTSCTDAFFQIPFGKNVGGMILGAHFSYLDAVVWGAKAMEIDAVKGIERAPYIRDFFVKACFNPLDELDISLLGFFGSDGLEIDQTEEKKGLKSRMKMDYDIYQALGGINVKYLAGDRFLFHGLLSYNGIFEDMELKQKQNGSVKYNDDFVSKYSSQFPSVTSGASYSLSDITFEREEKVKNHLLTGRLESEIEITEKNHLCAGIEETFQTAKTKNSINGWTDVESPAGWLFTRQNYSGESDGNCIFDHAAFLSWTYGSDTDLFQWEAGLRGEFISLQNFNQDYSANFIPDLCPRASLTFTPWRNAGILEKISFTGGAGLFVSIPRETMMFEKSMGLKDFEINPNRALLGIIGADAELDGGWKLKCEAYYKYYLSRIYNYSVSDSSSGYQDVEVFAKSDGKGYAFGIDSMIEKKIGQKWDGYISYSFVYSRLKNPAGIKEDQLAQSSSGSPLDQWYFPAYHRFHTVNLVSNWHFGRGWTFTLKGSLASGRPEEEKGDMVCYAAKMEDGSVIQRYSRSSFYSDSLRTNISCPVDLRISREWKTNGGKTSWEWYFALQDIFVNLYSPKGEASFNPYTGESSSSAESLDFSIGIPIPSMGMKIRF